MTTTTTTVMVTLSLHFGVFHSLVSSLPINKLFLKCLFNSMPIDFILAACIFFASSLCLP